MYITTKRKFQEIETEKGDITEQFHQFKNDFLDEFNGFKTKFLHEVKSFKDSILNTTPKNTGNQEHIITLSLDNIIFLKDQPRQKGKVIDSLINQLSKQNDYLFQKRNTDNQLETKIETVESKEENAKSKETEKIIITADNKKTEDTGERKSEKGSETSISNNKSSQKDISHEVEPIHQTAKKIQKTMPLKEEKMLLYKTKRYLQRNILLQVPQRNILVAIQEQITRKYRELRNP